jgi:hypothetical protein
VTKPGRLANPDAERLNDQIHQLLREAAEEREVRSRDQATQDSIAARRQFEALLELARPKVHGPRVT